jgi:hypothetical protein
MTLQDQLLTEIRAILAEDRFGKFSHPVTLGLLIANDIAAAAGSATPEEDEL